MNIKLTCLLIILGIASIEVYSQNNGVTNNWILGYGSYAGYPNGHTRIEFIGGMPQITSDSLEMDIFRTSANISDAQGNLLFYTNGYYIADATNDTMQNGNNISPTGATVLQPEALNIPQACLILPKPGSNSIYYVFHNTVDNSPQYSLSYYLYMSTIDMSLNNGLGAVTSKNVVMIQDSLNAGKITACKHANGRDWWIVALKDMTTIIHKFLLDSNGITYMGNQNLGFPLPFAGNATQPTFSPDGTKFVYGSGQGGTPSTAFHDVRLFNFDRCSGHFSGLAYIPLNDSIFGFGLAFSPNSKYLYNASFQKVYQFNTDTSNIAASKTIVAVNDGYYSPYPPFQTDFWFMYLAANGKIYISPGNGVVDLHYINYPDSAGFACDVHLHDLHLPCYSFRGNVNHPNYYLGCDTTQTTCPCLTTGINEVAGHDFKFSISPNPSGGYLKIMYLLPQNQKGLFEVFDITGKKVFSYNLPPWSTLQQFDLRFLSGGIYNCMITSGNERVSKKLVVVNGE